MSDELKVYIDGFAKDYSNRLAKLDELLENEFSAIAMEVIENERHTEA